MQSNDRATTETERLHDLLGWLNRVDKFVAAQMLSASAENGAEAAQAARMSTSPPPLEDHETGGMFRCVLGSDHLPDQHRPVQARLVQASLQTDTAPTLVLVVTCSLSRQQLWCSEVAPLLFSDPCAKTLEISFKARSPRTSPWTLKFDRSEPMLCFHSLVRQTSSCSGGAGRGSDSWRLKTMLQASGDHATSGEEGNN